MLTCFRRELNRTGVKKAIVFILVFAIMTGCLSTILAPKADAASYRVKKWKYDDDEYCYGLYSGSLPSGLEPTFIQFPSSDVYKSGKIKISFYWPEFTGNEANEAMTKAFCLYLGKNCNTKYSWCYHYFDVDYSPYGKAYYPWLISGWRCDKDPIDTLLSKSPFMSADGTTLYLEVVGTGNLVSSTDNNHWGFSFTYYFPDANMTIGFTFLDSRGDFLELYNPY